MIRALEANPLKDFASDCYYSGIDEAEAVKLMMESTELRKKLTDPDRIRFLNMLRDIERENDV